jgi:hypothetical protein
MKLLKVLSVSSYMKGLIGARSNLIQTLKKGDIVTSVTAWYFSHFDFTAG